MPCAVVGEAVLSARGGEEELATLANLLFRKGKLLLQSQASFLRDKAAIVPTMNCDRGRYER